MPVWEARPRRSEARGGIAALALLQAQATQLDFDELSRVVPQPLVQFLQVGLARRIAEVRDPASGKPVHPRQ